MNIRTFASDNTAGIHPRIFEAIQRANIGHAVAYGNDIFTDQAIKKFKDLLGHEIDVYFVYGGTGANVLGLKAIANSYNAIYCSDVAHLNVYECGATENLIGSKLLLISTQDGKITVLHQNGLRLNTMFNKRLFLLLNQLSLVQFIH